MNGNTVTSTNGATPAERLASLGLTLPPAPAAAGAYAGAVLSGPFLAIAGQLPRLPDGTLVTGRLGEGLTLEEGQRAAQVSALNILAQAQAALSDLSRISATLRINGFMQATPGFSDHPKVLNAASDLIAAVLGPAGIHTRVAVGAASLPLDAATEIDALFLVAS